MGVLEVTIPYAPRPLQRKLHALAESHRFGTIVTHRRFGKTVFAVNHLSKRALTRLRPRPRSAHIFPTYSQGKSTAWDYAKFYARVIPGVRINESELRIDFPNEGQYRIFGADNPDSLRGHYFDDVAHDEYGMQPPRTFSEIVRPALSDREGSALFLGTPNGKNQFYKAKQDALANETGDWFFAEYKASETGILSAKELADNRAQMTADEYAQEYECSFEASVKGAVFAREIIEAREDGRITHVPYERALPVHTAWDLGVGDATAIWFTQTLYTGEVRVIDYYESSGVGLQHYGAILKAKPYAYGVHWAPHDIEVREFTSGQSRREIASNFGIHFSIVPKTTLEDGIHAARVVLPQCWFDAEKCEQGLEALQHYRWDYNTRIFEFKHLPVHDWASHGADAFRYFALSHQTPRRPKRDPNGPMRDYDPMDRPGGVARFGARGGY